MSVNQKGTALVDGAATDEVLASSDSILTKTMYGGKKGLQQFYSPPELARLVASVIGDRAVVLDPTAGDGMLLSELPMTLRYGIEIDKDQIKNSKEANRGYNALRGDVQHIYTLLRQTLPAWDAIVANPPFGLQWEDPSYRDGKATNSAVLTWVYSSRLLDDSGQLIFVCGRDRFYRQIEKLDENASTYAVIECDNLFDNVTIPCVVAFAIHAGIRSATSTGYETRAMPREMLDLAGDWVRGLRDKARDPYHSLARSGAYGHHRSEALTKIQTEYDRRLEGRVKANREYDAILVGGKAIQWMPSGFAQLALNTENDQYAFHGLNGQPVTYFAQNERLWVKMLSYADRGILTVDPKLIVAIEDVVGGIRRERIPLYHVKPTMRLGFLTDVEILKCIKDDPELSFKRGESYRLNTQTKTVIEREKRIVESKKNKGEYVKKEYEKQKKALAVTVGHHTFLDGGDEASKNIKWLIDHFELPDPGDVATRHPEEIARLETLVREVMDEFMVNSRKWEEDNPTAMPFSIRDFQVQDIARMLFKKTGLLSWEQGLGKTLGGIAFYRCAVKLGAQDALLIVTANDLIAQWCRECERFLGRQPTLVKTHGQARKIAHELRLGGSGLYITQYYTLSLTGTRGKNLILPPVTVREWQEPRKVKGTDRWGYYFWADRDGNEVAEEDAHEAGRLHLVAQYAEMERSIPEYGFGENQLHRAAVQSGAYIQEPSEYETPSGSRALHGHITYRETKITKKLTSRDLCPACEADLRNGWNGAFCERELPNGSKCGYSHHAVKMKPIASQLSTAFRNGVGIYDEIQMIQARCDGTDSKRSIALRGPKFGWFLGLTGTPIKNFIDQLFWPLWKPLGNATTRFPFDYTSGPIKFTSDFAVTEYQRNGGRRDNRKFLAEVTNLSMLWRLLASSIIRRRKEETGETIVAKYYNEIKVPIGMAQAEQIDAWLKGFPEFFKEKNPEHPVVKAGMHEILAPTLGMNWKLDYACTLPEADPDFEWTGVDGVSNFTPANLRTLELTLALVKQGRKVLLGSNLKATSAWLADRLVEKGVRAVHILDEDGNTIDADERAKHVYSFQTDDVQVFCAGTKAIRLGHNLDAASAVILHGLDFDYELLDQFIARIHRLTSKEPVDVFVILPTLEEQQTITTRKWDLLEMKGGSAELALDGRLILKNEQQISEAEMIRDLMERGFKVTSEAVDETTMFEAWEALAPLDEYEIREGVIPARPMGDDLTTEAGRLAAEAIGNFLIAGMAEPQEGDQLDIFTTPTTVPDEFVLQTNADELDAIEAELAEAELAALEAILAEPENVTPDTSESDPPLATFTPFAGDTTGQEAAEAIGAFLTALAPRSEATASEDEADQPTQLPHPQGPGELPVADPIVHDDEPEPEKLPAGSAETPSAPVVAISPLSQLREAKELLDLGILDDNEYAELKAALLSQVMTGVPA